VDVNNGPPSLNPFDIKIIQWDIPKDGSIWDVSCHQWKINGRSANWQMVLLSMQSIDLGSEGHKVDPI
jgi:hypothetical protein